MSNTATSRLLPSALVVLAACQSGGSGGSGGPGVPQADAGADRSVFQNDIVVLDASMSSDPEGDALTYRWRLSSRPAGSAAALDDPGAVAPRFTPDAVGDYVLELVVSDGRSDSQPATITVTAQVDISIRVGAARGLQAPSEAVAAATHGDVVSIDAGTYSGDVAVWWQDDLTIRSSGGVVDLRADGQSAQDKALWVVRGARTTIDGVSFSGVRVRDGNGAGIRLEGKDLTLRNCVFDDNEMGFLAGDNPDSDIVFEHCEFKNATGTGALGHNVYVNKVRSFVMRHCYAHHGTRGHNVKSRAQETRILYCRIMDEADGQSSYAIDLPNGGLAFLIGNLIQQGPETQNPTLISFGGEGTLHPVNELHMAHNTVVDDRGNGRCVAVYGSGQANLVDNVFAVRGRTVVLDGRGSEQANLVEADPGFVDRDAFDYRLTPTSAAIDAAIPPGTAHGVDLTPTHEYVHLARTRPRTATGAMDLGALEARSRPR